MTDHLPDGYCLWDLGDTAYNVGILGTGPGFLAILDIIFNPAIGELLPPLKLTALCEPGPETQKLKDPRVADLPVHDSFQEMLASHPEINLLIELAGKRHQVRKIAAALPDHVSLIDHTSSFFLCALNKFASVTAHCQVSLDNQRILLQAIIDEVPEDIALLDKEGRVVDCNRNVALRRGVGKDELIGKPCGEVLAIRDDMPFCSPDIQDCPFRTALSTGFKAESLETRVSRDGRLLYFREYAYPIRDASHALAYVMVMRRDITARTELEKRAQQSEQVGVVERLSAYMAHELRNPLFAIGGFTNSLLKSPNLSEREREKVTIILEETARLDAILKELLGFARPGADVPTEVDLAKLVREAAAMMETGFLPKGVSVSLALGQDVPRVVAHEDTLRRAVIHLIANAAESMEAAGRPGVVEVSVEASGRHVVLVVEDTGKGMPREVLEGVFSPFFSTKGLGKGKGYGLNLALMRKAAEDWGGQMEIFSREGQGTRVTLRLAPVLAVPGMP